MSVYKAYISTDHMSTYSLLHDASDEAHTITGGKVTQDVAAIDSFVFKIYPTHESFSTFGEDAPYNVFCKVEDSDGVVEFEGRVIGVAPQMDSDGLIYKTVTCEGLTALLMDVTIDNTAILQPGAKETYDGERSGVMIPMSDGSFMVQHAWYFKRVMGLYNDQAESWAKMVIGGYCEGGTDTFRNSHYYVSPTYGTAAYDVINDLIEDELSNTYDHVLIPGGEESSMERIALVVERDSSGRLVCSVKEYRYMPGPNPAVGDISLGDNMGSFAQEPDYTDIVTEIIPLGREKTHDVDYSIDPDQFEDREWDIFGESGIDPSDKLVYEQAERESLSDVLAYYDDKFLGWLATESLFVRSGDRIRYVSAYKKYGRITRPLVVDQFYHERESADGDTEYFMTTGDIWSFIDTCARYLIAHSKPKVSVSVTAYDLSLLGRDYSKFKLMDFWKIKHRILGTDEPLPIVRRTVDMDDPAQSTVEFGERAKREADIQAARAKRQLREQAETENPEKDSSGNGQDEYVMAGKTKKPATVTKSSGGSSPLLLPFNVSILEGLSGNMKSSGGGYMDLSSAFMINRYSMSQVDVTFCLQHIIDAVSPGYISVTPSEMMAGGITREVVDKYAEYGLFRVDRLYGNARYGTDVDIQRSASKRFVLTDITASAVRDSGREYIMNLKWEYVDPPFSSQTKLMRKMIGEGKTEAGDIYYEYASLRWVKLTIDIGTRAYGDVTGRKLSDLMDIRAHGFFVDPGEPMQATNSSGAYVVHKATAVQSVLQGQFKFWAASYLDNMLHNHGGYSNYSTSRDFAGELLTIG